MSMYRYKAPSRDILFSAFELFDFDAHYKALPGAEDINQALASAILDESVKFAEEVLAPLNATGDEVGANWSDGNVTTPAGFKEAFAQFTQGQWVGLSSAEEFGGQGLPRSLDIMTSEPRGAANLAWSLCPTLGAGAINTLTAFGSAEQKRTYLTRLVAGDWTASMCLTEPHCGTDLGLLRTKASANADGSYAISGTKIFITFGEHDWTDNIVHIVLARLPNAPAGTKGISLFIVPKFNVNDDGSLGNRNGVSCGSIERKMGIHGSPTCVMNFDGAKGYLLGEENRGLNCMFTFMNTMRIGTATQGILHAQVALQKSQAYARERLQMRSLSGVKCPAKEADPIVVHPDVRRMLLTQKSIAEGGRMFIHYLAVQLDLSTRAESEETRKQSENLLSLLTPIAKAFLTELGLEASSLGIQCFGGHGFICEAGVEQNYRDARISTLYEGTTGIQALDLMGRKILGSAGALLMPFTDEIKEYCLQDIEEDLAPLAQALKGYSNEWLTMTQAIAERAMENVDEVGAASVDYLMYSGYTILAYFWLQAAQVASKKVNSGQDGDGFYKAKMDTAHFYFQRMMPRAGAHKVSALAGAETLMAIDETGFDF